MITLLHGDDTTASRNYYFELRKKSPDNNTFAGANITVTDLQQALSGDDLFGSAKQIFIEELLSKKKSSKELDSLTSLISQSSQNITLWESKEITKKTLQQFNNITIKQFRIPATIFSFLDNLKPGNNKRLIELFHKTLQDKDPEFVLVMLQRQARLIGSLLIQGETLNNQISELSRLAPWQKSKLEKQAQLFTKEQLLSLHEKLFQLELAMKTGQLSSSLENEVDFMLLNI